MSATRLRHSSSGRRGGYSRGVKSRPGRPGRKERTVRPVPATAVSPSPTSPVLNAEPIIAASDVSKRYGQTVAVDGLDLSIIPGEIFGILGPNGAGKTTTLEMLEGLRAPDQGVLRVAGYDPVTQTEQ